VAPAVTHAVTPLALTLLVAAVLVMVAVWGRRRCTR